MIKKEKGHLLPPPASETIPHERAIRLLPVKTFLNIFRDTTPEIVTTNVKNHAFSDEEIEKLKKICPSSYCIHKEARKKF